MKVVAFVPIKLNNQRFQGKNIRCFDDGKPLLTLFLETLVKVDKIDEIYVFCSSCDVEKYLVTGVKFLKRDEILDGSDTTPQDIISAFMKSVEADIYGMCHCTSPFVTVEHFSECIDAVLKENYDSAFTAEKIQRLFWTEENKPLNFDADNIPRTQDLPNFFTEVSAAYFFRKDVFERTNRRIGLNPYKVEVSGLESVDIDYQEDFEIANALYMSLLRGGYRKRIVSTTLVLAHPFYQTEVAA